MELLLTFDLKLNQYGGPYEFMSCFSCSPSNQCEALLPCGHKCQSLAHDEDVEHIATYQCQAICNTILPCGHICASVCHVEDAQHQVDYKCILQCEGLLVCGHACAKSSEKKHKCSAHEPCRENCNTLLPCGHQCSLLCHAPTSEHTECSQCNSLEPTDVSGSVEDETSIKSGCSYSANGNNETPSKSDANDHTILTHKCKFKQGVKDCKKMCKAVLSCPHNCFKDCYLIGPYNTNVLSCRHICSKICHSGKSNHLCSVPNCAGASIRSDSKLSLTIDGEGLVGIEIAEQGKGLIPEIPNQSGGKPKLPFTNRIENVDSGTNKQAGSVKGYIPIGHKCLEKGVCHMMCKTVLFCGHRCPLICHINGASECGSSHGANDKCYFCSKSETIWKEFSTLQIDHQKGCTFRHCSHHVKDYQCDEICPGKPCGHFCNLVNPHRCSDHDVSKKVCRDRCGVLLSCRHRCRRECHLGDYMHNCYRNKCCVSRIRNPAKYSRKKKKRTSNRSNEEVIKANVAGNLMEDDIKNSAEEDTCSESSGEGYEPASRRSSELNVETLASLPEPVTGPKLECGHPCGKKSENVCSRLCGYVLKCNHTCKKGCHFKTSQHVPSEMCVTCDKSENIREELRVRGVSHPKGVPYTHCSHYAKRFQCDEACKGRLCGHKCGTSHLMKPHSCSAHVPLKNYKCWKRCDVRLLCGHKCTRTCHLGDDGHICARCRLKLEESQKLNDTNEKLAKAELELEL